VIARDSQPDSTTNSFTLKVVFTNYPPVFLTAFTSLTVNENARATNLSFAISDIETAAASLKVTAAAMNPALVATNGLSVDGKRNEPEFRRGRYI